ncbi:MAG: hypothetical protein ACK4RK_20720 [Gemmataceae bacterium]
MTDKEFASHWQIERYGDFWLTDAIRPGLEVPVAPRQGYRMGTFRNPQVGLQVPVLAAAVSRENLFDVFLTLLEPLGEVVDVVLETSHHSSNGQHQDLCRQFIDQPVLQSYFCDFEELLLHDGCTGVAVLSTTQPIELQFDEHKLLIVYARELRPFENLLRSYAVPRHDDLKLISEGEHLHGSRPEFADAFEQLCCRVGVSDRAERVSW